MFLGINLKQTFIAVTFSLGIVSLDAQATLTSITTASGVNVVHSSESDVTWTKDANLMLTLIGSNTSTQWLDLLNGVTSNSGLQLAANDFDVSSGRASFKGANAFINYLNSINYGGSNQWRLPTTVNTSVNPSPGVTNPPSNGSVSGNELSELYYQELGGKGGFGNGGIPNTSIFDNVKQSGYWTGPKFADGIYGTWAFDTSKGLQYGANTGFKLYVWAVTPGRISPVPEAESWVMLLAGVGTLAGAVRRRRNNAK